ncbi:retrovirus-related pol polyprotein from transposon TNT 1-94 [Tanacetum coccineum]
MEGTVDITEFFKKLKFVCHWADPIKDFEWPNVPGIKLSSLSESDDTFPSLQVLSDLYNLFGGFMDYLWSRELDISNFGPADRIHPSFHFLSLSSFPFRIKDYLYSSIGIKSHGVGRQTSVAAGTSRTYTLGASGNNSGKQRTVICYNCKGEGHMSKQCTKPKMKRDDSCYCRLLDSPNVAVQNSNSFAQQDDLILSVIEQLKTQKTSPIVIPDSEETLTLTEESHSKMLLKHKDNMMQEKIKQIDTTPIHYADLNKLYKDFETRFVPQTKLFAEQAFWLHNFVSSSEPDISDRPNNVEVPKELPKVSMVNTSLKKLKYHLANFDVVVKERTMPTAIIEGMWGFKHTKACFKDEIIPFVKAMNDLFSTFNQQLVDELAEVQNVFYQMEQAVEQHRVESKTFEVKMNQALNENERLLEQVMSKDIVNLIVNSSMDFASVNVHECEKCLKLETVLQNIAFR